MDFALDEQRIAPHMRDVPERRERWKWLTEGIETDAPGKRGTQKRILTEQMLDNLAVWYKNEGASYLQENTATSAITSFTTFAFPLIRRIYPRLLAADLATVQPMTQPTGKIFYLDFKRDNGSGVATTRLDAKADFDEDYANSTEAGTVKEINVEVTDQTVTAVQKKLKAIWTIETQQDLKAYHALDAESELMTVLGDEITREIDRTLIGAMLAGATAGNVTWNKTDAGAVVPTEKRAHAETLYEALVDANNMVFKKRYKNTNWMVADPDTCGRLEKLQGFQLADVADNQWNIQHGGRHLYGTLKNRWLIYKDPWFDADKILLGYKGESFLDAGFVYAPYIPFYVTPLLVDPNDFKPRRGMMSRYASTMVVGDMYSTVTLA